MPSKEQDIVSSNNDGTYTTLAAELASDRFAHHMVSAAASRHPEALAIASAQGRLSYRELDARANQLAQHFRAMGIGPEDVVALWMTRSPWLLVAALAVFKAGAAYLPMDVTNPRDRLLFMVNDCGAKLVVTESALAECAGQSRCPVLYLDRAWKEIETRQAQALQVELCPDALAYVIYTSGSTGVPKGVEITHANLANLISWHNRVFQVTEADCASHLAGLGFDASVWETWPYLASGASLHMANSETLSSPERLRCWLVENSITIGFVPTPMAERIIDTPWPEATKLRVLLTGGDTLHARPIAGLPFTLVNNYGPTECTVVATWTTVPSHPTHVGLPPIGAPIDNSQVYIVDEYLQPVADGVAGELFVGGANVGRGYRNHPELTAERFVANPFAPGTKLYKTGDLGRRLPDGQIAFLGRIDQQIKIRGYRIEPGEIAAAMNAHASVAASAVMARADGGDEKRLVGYVVANGELTRSELQRFLLDRLPDYMVPSVFVVLDGLPLTANGKVDHTVLPPPALENTLRDEPAAMSSETEATLASIASELLRVPEVGLEDDFFLLGGHSLLGTQLIVRIRESFGVEIPLRTMFEQPTVRGLAAEIEQLLIAKAEEISEDKVQITLERRSGNDCRDVHSTSNKNSGEFNPYVILDRTFAD
jgi:amino acid adenylation domain-containing protein